MIRPAGLLYSLAIKNANRSGVLDTLESRLKCMQSVIPGSYGLCFYREQKPDDGRYQRIRFVKVKTRWRGLFHILFPLYLWRWIKTSELKPLYVVVRYHFPSPLFGLFFRKKSFTLVSEHHTDLEANLSTLSGFAGKALPGIARALRPPTDYVMDGAIGLTREILGKKPEDSTTLILANGINPEEQSSETYQVFDGRHLNAVTIISSDWKWNGFERIISSMESWAVQNPEIAFKLTVIGPLPTIRPLPGSRIAVELLGAMEPHQIARLVANFNVAFSTLGMWQMGLHEACPLKSRTYIGLGIPYVSGYVDPDLDDSRLFVERVPSSPEPINWIRIQHFLDRLARSRSDVLEDLAAARSELSHVRKSTHLNTFLSGLPTRS